MRTAMLLGVVRLSSCSVEQRGTGVRALRMLGLAVCSYRGRGLMPPRKKASCREAPEEQGGRTTYLWRISTGSGQSKRAACSHCIDC